MTEVVSIRPNGPTPRELIDYLLKDWEQDGPPTRVIVITCSPDKWFNPETHMVSEQADIEVRTSNLSIIETQGLLTMAQLKLAGMGE